MSDIRWAQGSKIGILRLKLGLLKKISKPPIITNSAAKRLNLKVEASSKNLQIETIGGDSEPTTEKVKIALKIITPVTRPNEIQKSEQKRQVETRRFCQNGSKEVLLVALN